MRRGTWNYSGDYLLKWISSPYQIHRFHFQEVASATANLVKHAKSAALAISQEATELANTETDSVEMVGQRDDKVAFLREAQSRLVHAATRAGKTTSRLVTSAKVAVCTMEQPASQRQLFGCVKQV